jgi:hypothetical protein
LPAKQASAIHLVRIAATFNNSSLINPASAGSGVVLMNAALLLLAALTVGQAEPPVRIAPEKPAAEKPDPAAKAEEPLPFTLDDLAAGAKNDAFVDEFLKEKKLSLYGLVHTVERFTREENGPRLYRLVMRRLGREDRAVDVTVYFYFAEDARKTLSLLEPDVAKITVQGNCKSATLQTQDRGMGFLLLLEDCKIIPTPAAFSEPTRGPPPAIIPNITNEPMPPRPTPPLPPLPQQP